MMRDYSYAYEWDQTPISEEEQKESIRLFFATGESCLHGCGK